MIQGSTEDLSGVARSLSSIDIDDELSDSDSTETLQHEALCMAAATAPRTAVLNAPGGKKRRGMQNGADIAMLLQPSPPFLLAETPPVESGPLEPTYSFASIPKEAFSGSFSSTDELPDPTRLGSSGGTLLAFANLGQ